VLGEVSLGQNDGWVRDESNVGQSMVLLLMVEGEMEVRRDTGVCAGENEKELSICQS